MEGILTLRLEIPHIGPICVVHGDSYGGMLPAMVSTKGVDHD